MGRPRTGCAQYKPGRGWIAVLTLEGGKRSPPIDMPGITENDEAGAKRLAAVLARRAIDRGATTSPGDTVAEWSQRWLEWRTEQGITTVHHDRGRLRKHVLPILGPHPMATIGRDEIEMVVEDLDRKIRLADDDDESLEWKTCSNIWVLVTKMFDDAVNAKKRDLRVRTDNPAKGIKGPERGEAKAKQYLYPSEFSRLVACKDVPLPFRTLYAVAVYTFMRAGELEALTWDDVDLEHGVIHITKAVDRRTGKVKSTKSGDTRRIPIEPCLMPLLERLNSERKDKKAGSERVLWLPDDEDRAVLLRETHLLAAQVKRAELYIGDAHRKHITFHDLRATGITWMAVRGDDPLRIKQRAGHKGFSTTEIYIREAENLGAGFGEPFPELPEDLTGSFASISSNRATDSPKSPPNRWSKGGSNTPPPLGSTRENPRENRPIGRAKPSALAERNVAKPSVETLRAKLDAAIIAERWDAVSVIRERIVEVERAAGNVVPIHGKGR